MPVSPRNTEFDIKGKNDLPKFDKPLLLFAKNRIERRNIS